MNRTSANALPAAFWNLIEIYNDPKLLGRVQHTLSESIVTSDGNTTAETLPLRFDLTRTLSSPLLQSVYAEVLRQRISLFHNRSPTVGDYKLGPFALRNGGLVCVSTDIAHNSEKAWGPARTERPLGEFWAERFLVPAADGKEGEGNPNATTEARFSTEGLDGAWIPYGGGALMCPGRHLAKIKMLGSVAVFSAYFDMEVPNGVPRMDEAFFGMGSQPPGEPVPVRMRRKVGDARVSASVRRNRAPSVWFSHEQYH